MKRIVCIILPIILIFLCCSCGLFGDQEYVCKVEDVASVQIVRLDKYVQGEYRFEYTVLSQIDDFDDYHSTQFPGYSFKYNGKYYLLSSNK